MAGPHRLWVDRGPHSEALLARVRRLLTLEEVHAETVARGRPISVSHLQRMESDGVGSDEAWAVLAQVLHVDVEAIRPLSPARGSSWEDQLSLPWASSS